MVNVKVCVGTLMYIRRCVCMCETLTSRKVNMLQFISHKAHVVGSRCGKRQETGKTHPLNPPVEEEYTTHTGLVK